MTMPPSDSPLSLQEMETLRIQDIARRLLSIFIIGWVLAYALAAPAGTGGVRAAAAPRGQGALSGNTEATTADSYTCPLPLEILPLGDSITAGKSSGEADPAKWISYRKDLYDTLLSDGYEVDFIGDEVNGQFYTGFDPDHAGYPDATVRGIADLLEFGSHPVSGAEETPGPYLETYPADVILLHIGTNGPESDTVQMERILDLIDDFELSPGGKTVKVIVAEIINRSCVLTGCPESTTTTSYNNAVADLIAMRGDPDIVSVDMEFIPGFDYHQYDPNLAPDGDMWDNLHPYKTGFTLMAQTWLPELHSEVLQFCNQRPDVTQPANQVNGEGDLVSLQIEADPRDGDALVYSATGLPAGLSIHQTTGLISGNISYDAAPGSPYAVTVTVTDEVTTPVEVSFTWTVSEVNAPPEVTNPGNQESIEGEPVHLQIQASDQDNDALSFSAVKLPPGLSIDPDTGVISGTINHTAAAGSPYQTEVTVTDDDPTDPKSTTVSFAWTVANDNRSPQITNPPGDQAHPSGAEIHLEIEATDPDGDLLTFTATGLPPDLDIDPATGVISGILTNASAGSHQVEVVVSDGDMEDSISFVWEVTAQVFLPVVIDWEP